MPDAEPAPPFPGDPYPLAMVVCDAIAFDPDSGKRTIVGVFSRIYAPQFPITLPRLAVYAALSEWVGRKSLVFQIVGMEDAPEPIFRLESEFEVNDPLAVLELDFRLGFVTFPTPGQYRLQLFAGGAFITERILVAQPLSEPEP